ncbi:hypothetical protein EDB85DRAFT_702141 [Lactarius pseudohatsudake]|nr:hypothetical protein EDB85DRAFT_702141 [Lactarius pseudohatsudake]
MNDFVHSIPKATFSLNGQCLQIIQPTFGRLAFDAADDAAKRVLLAQAQANQSYPEDRKAWFLEYTERASDLDVKMPNENFAIVRSSSARSTVEDDIIAVLRRSVRRFFFDESDIAAVQLAFATLRKEKNAAVRETMNDKAIDGNAASIEIQILSVEDDNDVTFKSAWFHLTSHGAIADVLSHPTNPSDVVLEYAPNIGICKSCFAITPVTRILSVLSEPINCRRDGGRSIPACQASSGQYPHIQSLMMTASIPKHIHSLASSTERMDPRFLVSVPSVQSSPLTPATIRMDFEFSAVVAFILRRIVSNHVQYPL